MPWPVARRSRIAAAGGWGCRAVVEGGAGRAWVVDAFRGAEAPESQVLPPQETDDSIEKGCIMIEDMAKDQVPKEPSEPQSHPKA